VIHRLRDLGARAASEAPQDARTTDRSVSLVLIDRSVPVRSAMEQQYPHLRKAQPRSLSGSGGRSDYLAGQGADLGGSRVGSRSGSAAIP
jgi:hypothetical protein